MQDKDFREILEKISTMVLVAEPVYGGGDSADDFKVLFVNSAFTRTFDNLVRPGTLFSSFRARLSKEMNWITCVNAALKYGGSQVRTIYSVLCSSWLKITIDVSSGRFIVVTIANVDDDKRREEQLRRQNVRLASLTEELSASRNDVRGSLAKISTLSEQLDFTVHHDAMTGMFGRAKLEEDFNVLYNESQGTGNKFGIMLIGIDNMKVINDAQGHLKGDEIICRFAELLRQFERDEIKFYRFGGDEFVALVNHVDSHNTILNMGDLLLEVFNAEGIEFSAGISLYPDDGSEFDELLRYADMAMFDMKKHGKNNVCFFQSVMRERFMQKLVIQNKLSAAFGRNAFQHGFELHYQPQFDVATNKLRGFEALLRWKDEELGWIKPDQFIPIAEETRLVVPLGDWVLETAIRTQGEWQKQFGFDGIMSINVSPVQLKKPTFIFDLSNLIEQYDVPPETLEIEITEGVFIDNKDETLGLLNQIRAMGVGISLDDFGTGYSSLSYLQVLPITTLKIDKSFISNIETDGVEANITDSIISMVTKMGLDTIAEGVEKPEQLDVLKNIKCRNIQGFLKGKPMPKERCEKILSGDYDSADHL